jgi:ParB/RepB/Spo0J family partition protein
MLASGGIVSPEKPLSVLPSIPTGRPEPTPEDTHTPYVSGLLSNHLQNSIVEIPISKLKIHPFNSRAHRTQERIEEVKKMLEEEHIQREPITVVPGRHPNDQEIFYVLSGQTRLQAAVVAGWSSLKAQINSDIDPEDHLAFLSASIEHNTTKNETDYDLASKADALLKEGYDPKRVMAAIKKDERGFRRIISMMKLPEKIIDLVKDNPTRMTASICEVLLSAEQKNLNEDTLLHITNNFITLNLSRRDLEKLIEQHINSKDKARNQRSTRIMARPIRLGLEKKKIGDFKIMESKSGSRLILLSIELPDADAQTFQTNVEQLLSKIENPDDHVTDTTTPSST